MSTPIAREPIRFEVRSAPQNPPAPEPRRPAPPARDVLDPPPENPAPRRRGEEGCGICSLICRCIAEFFNAIFRYFCPPSAPRRIDPPLNRDQQAVELFLNRFPPYIEDESSADRRDEFWTAFQRLPIAAQRAARMRVYEQHRPLIDAEIDRTAPGSANRLETKKPQRAFQQDRLSDAINDVIDNFIRYNYYNDAVRTALHRFIGREERSRNEE